MPFRRYFVRGTAYASGFDAGIDCFSEVAVFNYAHRFTLEKFQTFFLSGRLHPACVHRENQGFIIDPFYFLFVQEGIKSVLKALFKSLQPAAGFNI